MGHYAAEMACRTCKKLRCACPPPADTTLNQWVVDADYSVIQAHAFDAKYGKKAGEVGLSSLMLRLGRKHFSTSQEARVHALGLLRNALEKSEAQTLALKARLAEILATEAQA